MKCCSQKKNTESRIIHSASVLCATASTELEQADKEQDTGKVEEDDFSSLKAT